MASKKCYKRFLDPDYSRLQVSVSTQKRWKRFTVQNNKAENENLEQEFAGRSESLNQLDNNSCVPNKNNVARDMEEATNNSIVNDEANKSEQDFISNATINNSNDAADDNNLFYNYSKENTEINEPQNDLNTSDCKKNYQDIMFESSNLNVSDVLIMIQAFSLRFSLPYEGRAALFDMIKTMAGSKFASLQISHYLFSKQFDPPIDCIKYHFYCSNDKCTSSSILGNPVTKKDISKLTTASCLNCEKDYVLSLSCENYFISIDIEYQINTLLQDEELKLDLVQNVTNIIQEKKTVADDALKKSLFDAYDGILYNNIKNDSHKFQYLTYNVNTDGAPLFRNSSKRSMWPLQFTINEFTPKLRFQNIILAGMWICSVEPKPNVINLYISSLLDQSERLQIKCVNDSGDITFFKLAPLCAILDSVARPIVQNRIQFNGYSGCSWCYQNGTYSAGSMRYPLEEKDIPVRSHSDHLQDVKDSIRLQKHIRGVKGPAALSNAKFFNLVWGFPVEYMHGVILGVTKQIFEMWNRPGYFYSLKPSKRTEIDLRLQTILPPDEIHRLPRKISDRSKWKASEWKSWLLFYSVPVLDGIINDDILQHFSLLVKSIFTLLKTEVTKKELDECEIDLLTFVGEFQVLYGVENMTFNIHSLLHLVDSVKFSGPLWTTSAFPYESNIYNLKVQVNGPKGVSQQIATRVLQIDQLKHALNNFTENATCTDYCHSLFTKKSIKHFKRNTRNIVFLGQGRFTYNVQKNIGQEIFLRCVYNKCLYTGLEYYTRAYKNNNSVVQLKNKNFVQIIRFISEEQTSLMVCKQLICTELHYQMKMPHIFKVTISSEAYTLPVTDIKEKCVFLELSKSYFVCTFPNFYEVQ